MEMISKPEEVPCSSRLIVITGELRPKRLATKGSSVQHTQLNIVMLRRISGHGQTFQWFEEQEMNSIGAT